MNKSAQKSAQSGIVHVGLIVGLIIIGIAGVYAIQNRHSIFDGSEAASRQKDGSSKQSFSNLSAVLRQDSATFNFSYSASSPNYR